MSSKKICKSISIIPIHDFNLSNLSDNNLNENFWEFNDFGDEERDKDMHENNVAEKESDNALPVIKKRSRGRPKKKKQNSIDDNSNSTIINKNQNKNKKTYSKKKGKLIQKKLDVVKESKNDSNQPDKINNVMTRGLSKLISNAENNEVSKNRDGLGKNNDIEFSRNNEIEISRSDIEISKNNIEMGKNGMELSRNDMELSRNDMELSRNDIELSENGIELDKNEAESNNDNNEPEINNLNFNSGFNLNNENKIQVCASSINIEDDRNDQEKQVSKLILPSSLSYNLETDDNEITKVDNDNLGVTNNSDLDKLETFFSEYKLKMLKIEEKITENFQMEIRNHRHNVAKQVAQLIDIFKSQSVAGAGYGGQ